jgi:hypothetical protein
MRRLTLVPSSVVPRRLFLVPAVVVGLFLAVYFLPELGLEALRRWFRAPRLAGGPWEQLKEFQAGTVLFACAAYGLLRILPYHPVTRPGYKQWLELTPWTVRQPLPLGPVHGVFRDLLAVLVLTACGVRVGMHWAVPAAVAGMTYLLVLACMLGLGGAIRHATVLAFAPPLFEMLSDKPAWLLLAVAAFYCVGYAGLRCSLSAFPWRDPNEVHPSLKPPGADSLGWPLKWVSPIAPSQPLSTFQGFLIALLVAWWLLGAMVLGGAPVGRDPHAGRFEILRLMGIGATIGAFVAVTRAGIYIVGMMPPISTFGRIRTGRLVIPEYDRVFASPVLVWVLAAVTPGLVYYFLPVGSGAVLAISAFVVLAAAINLGPTMASWHLTGAGSYPIRVNREHQPKGISQA